MEPAALQSQRQSQNHGLGGFILPGLPTKSGVVDSWAEVIMMMIMMGTATGT
jgi:hypothetical protein